MGKGKKQYIEKLNKIQSIEREIQKEEKKIIVECSHQNEKGKLKIEFLGQNGDAKCKICGTKFNMSTLPTSEIDAAVKTLHDAIQQIRCYSSVESDSKLIRLLGELDFNLQESSELYDRVVNVYGRERGNKKKKKHDDDFGQYGQGGLSFIGGGRR